MRSLIGALCVLALLTGSALDAPAEARQDRNEALLEELEKLVDEGERNRAADTWLIEDLRSLIERYQRPWHAQLLVDTFEDGDYTQAPAWTVAEGRFEVDPKTGLHTIASPRTGSAQGKGEETSGNLGEKVARELLGALENSEEERSGSQERAPERGEIYIERGITNAFSVEVRLTASLEQGQGHLAFGPYQRRDRQLGYRLVYRPGDHPVLEIVRVSPRGSTSVAASEQRIDLADDSTHTLRWDRHADGSMTVTIDGKEVLATTDQRYGDPFDGLAVINEGGKYTLHRIAVFGTGAQASRR